MMNKKLIAILAAAMAVAGLSADYCRYHDCDGRGIVRGTFDTAGDIAEGTVNAADDVVQGTLGRGSILNPGNWGERGRERRAEARADRRDRRYYRD